jgi:hypothetical protein
MTRVDDAGDALVLGFRELLRHERDVAHRIGTGAGFGGPPRVPQREAAPGRRAPRRSPHETDP